MNIISRYFAWLQKDNPVGEVVNYPELTDDGETSLKGVYIVGDLTGIPLLKLATVGAAKKVHQLEFTKEWKKNRKRFDEFDADAELQKNKGDKNEDNSYDVVIVGAGPAGLSAAIEAHKRGYSYIVLEAADRPFNTIENFPKGKPMFYEPADYDESETELTMTGETKETLIDHLSKIISQYELNIVYGKRVETIESLGDAGHNIVTKDETYQAQKTILAIGKSGNHRKLGVPGESLPHVYNKLYDPNEYKGQSVLVVGGGDSALESARLLASAGAVVTLSYRGAEFKRPKPGNILAIQDLEKEGKLTLLMNSDVKEIREGEVDITVGETVEKKKADTVFLLLGTELPYEFFRRSGIKIENARTQMTWWWMALSVAFANVIYFGKASGGIVGAHVGASVENVVSGSLFDIMFKVIAWASIVAMAVTIPVVGFDLARNWKRYFASKWHYIKHGFFFFSIVLFLVSFFGNKYFDFNLGDKDPYFWYGFLYTVAIALFGARRIATSKKKYVTYQTTLLFLIQALPLFFIPNFILPWMNDLGLIHPWIVEHVFLGGEWWRFVGFILAWPLFFANVFTSEPSAFWLVTSLVQTFVIIPWLVIKFGKGAYCGWICSCGALAETMGNDYRTLSPHGARAKKLDNVGQVILFVIFLLTFLHALGWVPSLSGALYGVNQALMGGYKLIVDTFLAGTVGVGLYFFFGGRVWCRFFCPLAALMHIYNKFSSWRILSDKKKCISCGLCTKNCHMGIDVMGYAQTGRVLDDVECVNCSKCIDVCPTGVLSFGRYKQFWKK